MRHTRAGEAAVLSGASPLVRTTTLSCNPAFTLSPDESHHPVRPYAFLTGKPRKPVLSHLDPPARRSHSRISPSNDPVEISSTISDHYRDQGERSRVTDPDRRLPEFDRQPWRRRSVRLPQEVEHSTCNSRDTAYEESWRTDRLLREAKPS